MMEFRDQASIESCMMGGSPTHSRRTSGKTALADGPSLSINNQTLNQKRNSERTYSGTLYHVRYD